MKELLPSELFQELALKYPSGAWTKEAEKTKVLLQSIAESISHSYQITSALGVGGNGLVLKVHNHRLDIDFALKTLRPSPGKEEVLAIALFQERENLLRLRHPNIIRIQDVGQVAVGADSFPYYIMEFVPGVEDIDEFMKRSVITESDLLEMIDSVFSGLGYMHENETVHLDIKPANIFVTHTKQVLIADLGFAKRIHNDPSLTVIGGTEGFMHPEMRQQVSQPSDGDKNRMRGAAPRKEIRVAWDLYALGKTLKILLDVMLTYHSDKISPYTFRYLYLSACRLFDGQNAIEDELALGLGIPAFKEIKYSSVEEAQIDLRKLMGAYNIEMLVPELNPFPLSSLPSANEFSVAFTPRLKRIIELPIFRRLANVSQLGLLSMIFNTASHTRREHAIGTFGVVVKYISALYNDPINPLFRNIVTVKDIESVLLAALLHDLGHYPMAHDIEDADELLKHEEFGIALLQDRDFGLPQELEQEARWCTSVGDIIAILVSKPNTEKGTFKDRLLHSLIDGPIDADKIDYIKRDGHACRLRYGEAIDFHRLVSCLSIAVRQKNATLATEAYLGIHEKGRVPAEAVAFARYAMFAEVYWKHSYRAYKCMIRWLVWTALTTSSTPQKRKLLKKEFQNYVFRKPNGHGSQREIFEAIGDRTELADFRNTDVHLADIEVIKWFGERGGEEGKRFASMIVNRNYMFKRLLVLTKARTVKMGLWERLHAFFSTHGKTGKVMRRFNQAFQKLISDRLSDKEQDTGTKLSAEFVDSRNRFISTSSEQQHILVDVPRNKSDIGDLFCLIQTDHVASKRTRVNVDDGGKGLIRSTNLEESLVWKALQKEAAEALGKARVFCNPDYVLMLHSYFGQEELEDLLDIALQEAHP